MGYNSSYVVVVVVEVNSSSSSSWLCCCWKKVVCSLGLLVVGNCWPLLKETYIEFISDEIEYVCASQSSITSFQETPTSFHKGRKRKEYKKTSVVHSHSVVVGDSRICKHCDAAYSKKSTSAMRYHLKNNHNISLNLETNNESVDIDTSLDELDKPIYKKQKKNFTKAEEFLLQFICVCKYFSVK
ncbi:hypothetical protein BpHYR1_031341 [Brachionus plicatilis]|uniref:BED-type domain-containing protein n=1 Tax=Brachionus plicatilis TaxID=10195 RepID=A0A3M7RSK9_BRAPC|nr:hypothetical protein BpHYR1_031341 [Brachionus plicatilis]